MIHGLSHLVLSTDSVAKISDFFERVFEIRPYYKNEEFTEFVLPGKARIAFFKVTGATKKYFDASSGRKAISLGVTVHDVEATYKRATDLGLEVSGPPKDHPWGEKSFLLVDPDGNRWEVTKSPQADGFLPNLNP